MKKPSVKSLLTGLAMILVAVFSAVSFTSCEDDEETKNHESECYYRYWKQYPNSYIKMCDWRMTFRFTACQRVDGGLNIAYVMSNTGFDKKVQLSFWMPESAAHDDLGNTYKCAQTTNYTDVDARIDGKRFSVYGWGQDVTFMPNQAIKGSFFIKGFDQNATAVSVSCNVRLAQPSGESLMYEHIEFVNLPIGVEADNLERM